MVNRVVLVGRLVADPEMKYTPAGVAVAQMRIAVNRITKNDAGEYDADFFNVVAWRRTAEFASNYLTKGRLVSVDGRLQTRSWVTQDGQRRSVVEIVADNMDGLDRKGETGGSNVPEEAGAPVAAARTGGAGNFNSRPSAPSADEPDESDPFADE